MIEAGNVIKRWQGVVVAIAGAVGGAGCATKPPVVAPDPVQVQLAASAQSVRVSLRQLAEAEQYDKMRRSPGGEAAAPVIPGLTRVVAVPWQGPLEPVVRKLAEMGGYHLNVAGHAPAIPIVVSLGPTPASLSAHLRDVGLQAGTRADIIVDPARKQVGVVYANTGF